MKLKELKQQVLEANLDLVKLNLATFTWGNVSGISREEGHVVIKPSGIDYNKMKISDLVVVDLAGNVIEGDFRPSSDTPTHIELYKAFPEIGGIAHSHSEYATIFSQACKEIPCLGTTHADAFFGPVPLTRFLTKVEVEKNYELNTGKVIVERFSDINAMTVPGVLVAGHAPFTWGIDAHDAVKNNLILEKIAFMALHALGINPRLKPLAEYIVNKHHQRKHGPQAYYGQKEK